MCAVNRFKNSKAKFILVTSHNSLVSNFGNNRPWKLDMMNAGGYRQVNINLPPLEFPGPIKVVEERQTNYNKQVFVKASVFC